MVQTQSHDRVPRLEKGEIYAHVGLGPCMGLDVNVLGPEQLLGPFDGEGLGLVHELTATVVPFARIALGILVGQDGALGFHYRPARVVLRGDKHYLPLLPLRLRIYYSLYLSILFQ